MPTLVEWYRPHNILRIVFRGAVTRADYWALDQQMEQLRGIAGDNTVHLIVEHVDLEQLPGISALTDAKWFQHPHNGWVVLVGLNQQSNRLMYSIAGYICEAKLHMATNLEEATHFLLDDADSLVLLAS